MPIIVPEGDSQLYYRLQKSGAAVLTEEQASHQDIRPARIGILNLMPKPAMETTEVQWLRYMSRTVLQIEPVLVKFDDDAREGNGASRSAILSRYTSFSEVAEQGLDGLIVTGDNLELRGASSNATSKLMPLDDIKYAAQLAEVIDWARSNVRSTIYSCLASHFILNHLFGLERQIGESKIFGVFEHAVDKSSNNLIIAGLDDSIKSPHSRWGDIPVKAMGGTALELLAVSDRAGWLLASSPNSTGGDDLYIQGHPEYDRSDLNKEYQRDKASGQAAPVGYYVPGSETPELSWVTDARALHSNWIDELYKHALQRHVT
jgi:homoserine O-succinyltransferase